MKSRCFAIFASGNGSTAQMLLNHFEENESINVALILTNNPKAKVIEIGQLFKIPVINCTNEEANNSDYLIEICENYEIEYIVLAGYLRKIPIEFIAHFPNKIINIHPSLLPKFGGKGMYGMNVHEAVLKSDETETGISIHFVNEHFDDGTLIAQFRCTINSEDDAESIRKKIHELERTHFAEIVEKTIKYDRIF